MDMLRAGLIQMTVVDSKQQNLLKAREMILRAAEKGAQLVILPEMFNCPYDNRNFAAYAEREGLETWTFLSETAKENQIILVGGSMPEVDAENRIYNTSYVFDSQGQQIAKHRKVHLFDIDISGGQYFKESDTLTGGDRATVFDTIFGRMGLAICYDLRFPELSRLMVEKGAKIIIIPGAFNMTTGPAHWELLFRVRALDNQVFTIGVAPARNNEAGYVSYGNSLIVDPWGSVINRLDGEEAILVGDLNLELIERIRKELPLLKHLRKDIYQIKEAKKS